MHLYLAGNTRLERELELVAQGNTNRLLSYWEYRTKINDSFDFWKQQVKDGKGQLFLDSGAYSAFMQGTEVDIHEYVNFIHEHKEGLSCYAALDVIGGDAEDTIANMKFMEKRGLSPMPVYHGGEDWKYLDYYCANYEYIAIGGVAGVMVNRNSIRSLIDEVFNRYPNHKFHAFGITVLEVIKDYPFHSVDSTSWLMAGAMGSIMTPWGVYYVSDRDGKSDPTHLDYKLPEIQEKVIGYVTGKGFTMEQVRNNYTYRLLLNASYMKDFQDGHQGVLVKKSVTKRKLF